MAFKIVEKKQGKTPGANRTVRLAVQKHAPKVLQVIIPSEIIAHYGSKRFLVHVGTGADVGLLLLQPTQDKSGFALNSAGNTSARKLQIRTDLLTDRGLRPFKTTEVQHQIEPEGLIISVGAVFRINAANQDVPASINPRFSHSVADE